MKKFFKGFALMAILGLSVTSASSAFASEADPAATAAAIKPDVQIEQDLSTLNPIHPFQETKEYTDKNGNEYTVTNTFTPSKSGISTNGSDSNQGYAGVWTSKVTYGVIKMSYQFDLAKSGSQWKISNPRNHDYWGAFMKFSAPSLKVTRAVSTSSLPAEVNASVTAEMFDNAWVPLGSSRWIMYTTVSSSGWMVVNWN
ncbi:hypothetical protein [Paenibacillus shenyangensis]|uniref:hypothetical protein n=1 Tax=Paenibacillus sp. A9 TaxID=1284352 RepID=UPI00036E62C6|nr:hypothetical protein [Paenibacillus sp. A9]